MSDFNFYPKFMRDHTYSTSPDTMEARCMELSISDESNDMESMNDVEMDVQMAEEPPNVPPTKKSVEKPAAHMPHGASTSANPHRFRPLNQDNMSADRRREIQDRMEVDMRAKKKQKKGSLHK